MTLAAVDLQSYLFTTADLEHFRQISCDMIARGLWDSCERHTAEGAIGLCYDQWLIFTDALSEASFSIERRSAGRYFLTDARTGSCLVSGRTIQEVTRRWTAAFAI
jgi:hypothetical protein